MGLFDKLFNKKTKQQNPKKSPEKDPSKDPNMIRVFDKYGRELYITKQQWRDSVLLGNLENKKDEPEELYNILVGALQDGFANDIIPYAEHLCQIDTIPSRAATILGIVYMEVNRLDDAQRVLEEYIANHGEEGVILTNLAKVHSNRGNETLAESTLWRALELDPNQDNGLQWFATIHNDREGKSAMIDAFRRVAELPKSWRARLWIAREELESNNLISAKKLYKEAISLCDNPIPADLLMQMTGDLGNNGHLDEIISLAEPYFDPSFHGLQVGNNLIKANLDLSNFDNAKIILDALYTQNRPDWQETLSFWDTEIAKVRLSSQNKAIPDQHSCSLVSIEGPLWARDGSLFSSVLPKKHSQATRFAIIGSTALLSEEDKRPNLRLSDPPGRLSRAIPLFLAEQLCIRSDSVATALIPWIQDTGFALFGRPYNDQDLCALAEKNEIPPDYSVSIVLDAVKPIWKINAYLLDQKNKLRLAETSIETSTNNLGPSTELLINNIIQLIIKHTNTNEITCPSWYQVPAEEWSSDYLLRLEQQLAVACMNLDFLKGGDLSGEHEILNGCLWLCKSQPDNSLARIILVQMLCQMKKIRPNIVIEYKDKVIDLHHEHPLKTDLSELIEKTLTGVFES